MDVIPDRHRKKQRKPNSKTSETVVEPEQETNKHFSKRELVSNWDKYTDKAPSYDSAAQDTSNFEALLSKPASVGGHFLFNSEKSWESSDDWYNRDDYFQLNLMELSKSLATIPFYERQSYSKDIFNSEEIQDMDRQAKYHLFKWQSANGNNPLGSAPATMDIKCEISEAIQPQNDDDDLDELLKLTRTTGQRNRHTTEYASTVIQPSSASSVAIQSNETLSTAESTDDIQKWLDDVLVLGS